MTDTAAAAGATFSIKYLDLTDASFYDRTMATDEQKFRAIARAFEGTTIPAYEDTPADWQDGPLAYWCYLTLLVNGIIDGENPPAKRPLSYWGIDFTFEPKAVQAWLWFLA